MNNNVLTTLLCLAFAGIGFAIGRVTAPCHGHMKAHRVQDENVEVIVVEASDSVIAIPGGEITWIQDGEEVRVNVDMEQETEGKRVIERRVVVSD
jgi:hypothetical protein